MAGTTPKRSPGRDIGRKSSTQTIYIKGNMTNKSQREALKIVFNTILWSERLMSYIKKDYSYYLTTVFLTTAAKNLNSQLNKATFFKNYFFVSSSLQQSALVRKNVYREFKEFLKRYIMIKERG